MKKTIRLTESDLIRLVKKVINEQTAQPQVPTRQGTGGGAQGSGLGGRPISPNPTRQGTGGGRPISPNPTNQLPICKGGERGIFNIDGSLLFLSKFDGSKFCRISSQPQTTSVPRPAPPQPATSKQMMQDKTIDNSNI